MSGGEASATLSLTDNLRQALQVNYTKPES